MNRDEIKQIVSSFKSTCTIQEGEQARLRFNQLEAERNRQALLRRKKAAARRDSHASLFYESQFTYGSGARWTGRKSRAS